MAFVYVALVVRAVCLSVETCLGCVRVEDPRLPMLMISSMTLYL